MEDAMKPMATKHSDARKDFWGSIASALIPGIILLFLGFLYARPYDEAADRYRELATKADETAEYFIPLNLADCSAPHPDRGCNDGVIQQAVCREAPSCCTKKYEEMCADKARVLVWGKS